jgi:hypothetical protein
MKIILTETQLKKIQEISLRTPEPTRFRLEFKELYEIFTNIKDDALKIYKENLKYKNWDRNRDKQILSKDINDMIMRLESFDKRYLSINDATQSGEFESQLPNDIGEQIDTEDEENELMKSWYGDDSFDEYGSLDAEDEEDKEEMGLDFNYAPEYDMDSDDSYDLSLGNDLTNRMRRSVRVGAAGAVDRDTKRYTIDGKEYSLTPIEYREMLNSMGRITPEKAASMGVSVDNSGVIKRDKVTTQSIKYLRKRIIKLRDKIEYYEADVQRLSELGRRNGGLEHELEYLKNTLEYSMNKYDELTGNVDGEEYDF